MREKENLFDFGEAEMESGVDPSQDLRSSDEVSPVHHTDVRRHLRSIFRLFFLRLRLSFSFFSSFSVFSSGRRKVCFETAS